MVLSELLVLLVVAELSDLIDITIYWLICYISIGILWNLKPSSSFKLNLCCCCLVVPYFFV